MELATRWHTRDGSGLPPPTLSLISTSTRQTQPPKQSSIHTANPSTNASLENPTHEQHTPSPNAPTPQLVERCRLEKHPRQDSNHGRSHQSSPIKLA
jgi:hypothetical protein